MFHVQPFIKKRHKKGGSNFFLKKRVKFLKTTYKKGNFFFLFFFTMSFEEEKTWFVCCSKSSAQGVRYVSQVLLAAITLVWIMIQLSKPDLENPSIYWSLLSSLLFVFLPSPTIPSQNPVTKNELRKEFIRHLTTTPTPSVLQPTDVAQEHPPEGDVQEH